MLKERTIYSLEQLLQTRGNVLAASRFHACMHTYMHACHAYPDSGVCPVCFAETGQQLYSCRMCAIKRQMECANIPSRSSEWSSLLAAAAAAAAPAALSKPQTRRKTRREGNEHWVPSRMIPIRLLGPSPSGPGNHGKGSTSTTLVQYHGPAI